MVATTDRTIEILSSPPGSIAMTAFIQASLSFASFGSSLCSFILLRTLSVHLSLGLHWEIFPLILTVVTSVTILLPSLLVTWPYNEMRFWVSYVVIGLTIASLMNFSFLPEGGQANPPAGPMPGDKRRVSVWCHPNVTLLVNQMTSLHKTIEILVYVKHWASFQGRT